LFVFGCGESQSLIEKFSTGNIITIYQDKALGVAGGRPAALPRRLAWGFFPPRTRTNVTLGDGRGMVGSSPLEAARELICSVVYYITTWLLTASLASITTTLLGCAEPQTAQ
jgi:hypothetical protein